MYEKNPSMCIQRVHLIVNYLKGNELLCKIPQSRNSSMNRLWKSVSLETTAGILSSWGSIVHLKCQVPGTFHKAS